MANLWSPRERFAKLDDPQWLNILKRSLTHRIIAGVRLPSFPSDDIQIRTVGSAGAHALEEGFNFYRFVKNRCTQHGMVLGPTTNMLDFGIGWGRIARFFLKDVENDHLYGADVDATLVRLCIDTELPINVAHIDPRGSLPYANNVFELVIAYSVFTHLPEPIQDIWLGELRRALVPGGLFVATVQSPRTLDLFRSIDPDDAAQHFWHRRVAARIRKHPKCLSAFAEQGFAYLPSQAQRWDDPSETFGNAFISPRYVNNHWTNFFEILEYCDSPELPQAVVVARVR